MNTAPARSRTRRVISLAVRIGVSIAAIVLATVALSSIFSDLDWASVLDAVRSLSDADRLALMAAAAMVIAAQGLVTASTLPGLPVRRGIVAYLGPAAIASVIPGPSDLPVRYRIYQSWGYSPAEAGLSVSAGGIFNIGAKLVMPLLAFVVVALTGVAISDRINTTLLLAGVVLAVLIGATAVLLGSSRLTAWLAYWLQAPWDLIARIAARESRSSLGDVFDQARTKALGLLRERWPIATWAVVLHSGAQIGLMLMALRFTGVPQDVLGVTEVFVAFGVVAGLTVLPVTAGNVGIAEAGWIGVLGAMAGNDYINQVTAGVLIFRMLTWLAIIPLGGIALLIWRAGTRRQAQAVT